MEAKETIKMKNTRRDLFILTYTMFIALAVVALFLYGFFPIKYDDNDVATMTDIPDRVGHVRVKSDELYKPVVKKVIVMVIDALRWDFLTGPVGISAMPITNRLINEDSTCLMQSKVSPPTVTMPRIKAMMTGSLPSFVDVALNFGDLPVSGDSLLLQAKNHGHRIHFYGDDTWLKIFPGMFDRYEGTTSFFVSDFTEVDNNVTRHITKELRDKDDWSLLVLHYLGLDHIGHTVGPFSPLIKPKLREMDDIIGQIQKEIENWNENGLPALFVICGDHGMKDSGGHGGSTPEETLVPFFVIGSSCPWDISQPNRMSQVDVAATLSVMLGSPIPSSNIGSVPLHMLSDRSDSSKLFVLYYNGQQIFKHFKKLPSYESTQAYRHYVDAMELHTAWLTSNRKSDAVQITVGLYNKAFQNMKELLIRSTIDYDLHTMTIAMIYMAHIVHVIANLHTYKAVGKKKKLYFIIGSIISYFILRFIWEPENGVPVSKFNNSILNVIPIGILVFCHLTASCGYSLSIKERLLNLNLLECFLPLGMIVHIISLVSTSFVEEEHQTWFFIWPTFLILLIIDIMRKGCNVKLGIKIFLSLLGHRILRKLNSTGNKYAHSPDIAGWLRDQENNASMTALLLGALGILIWIGYVCEENKHKRKTVIVHIAAAICIYLRHMTSDAVAKLPIYFNSKGIVEVRIFWIIIVFYSLFWAYRLARIKERKLLTISLLRFIILLWVIISAILFRPHNVVLLPIQLLVGSVIQAALRTYESGEDSSIYVHMCLGNVFYFYQGNSNSLATIDVAAGYVGMESYRPVVTGIFLAINTYSAPVLAYLTLIYYSIINQKSNSYSDRILSINRHCALWRFLPLVVYTIIVTLQRFHLFVWTVFSPKLLYEAMYCLVMFAFFLSMQISCLVTTMK